jgi:tetratricopeptide (TPR) repeat protein
MQAFWPRSSGVAASALALALACSSTPAPEAPPARAEAADLSEADDEASGSAAGVAAIGSGDFESARKIFGQVVSDEPANAQAHFYLGVAQQNLGQGTEAIASYEKAQDLDPKLTEASINLTAALLDAGEALRALPLIERALANNPGHPGLSYNRALALRAAGQKEQAVAAYREALALAPENAEIKYGYAEALLDAGKEKQAIPLLEQLAQSDSVEVLASTARLLGSLKQFDPCIRALDKALAKQTSSELYVARGLCAHGNKDDAAAFADFQRAVQKDGSYAPGHYYVGMHLKLVGKKSEARAALTRAVEIAGNEGVGKAAKRALEGL